MNFNNVLKSKYLYYAAVALMVINVLGYVSLGSIECVLVLGGAAYLANQFTKNRTVDIFIGLFVSNILFGCGRLKEGFEPLKNKLEGAIAETDQAAKNAKCVMLPNALQGVMHSVSVLTRQVQQGKRKLTSMQQQQQQK